MNEHCAVSVDEICELDEVYRQCHIGGGGATMRDPVFTQTMQIGIVVRDLGATMRKYVDEYGIGPWKIYEFNPGNATDLREYGQPVKRSWRLVKAPAWVPARALALLFLTVESFSVTASLPFVYFQF